VDNYNSFRDKLVELTEYNPETNTGSILTGDGAALRLDNDLSYLLSGRFHGAGSITSLAAVGIHFNTDGSLQFDQAKLQDRYAEDPDAVQAFFTTEQLGFAEKFDEMVERLAGANNSLLTNRLDALAGKISQNEDRIASMDERLESERERLLLRFYRLETAIGKLQNNLSVIDAIQPIAPLSFTSTS